MLGIRLARRPESISDKRLESVTRGKDLHEGVDFSRAKRTCITKALCSDTPLLRNNLAKCGKGGSGLNGTEDQLDLAHASSSFCGDHTRMRS